MKKIKFLKIDKSNVLGVILGTEKNARIISLVEQVLTFSEIKFIMWDHDTSLFVIQNFRGNIKELISKFLLTEESIFIPEIEPKNQTEYVDWVNLLNNYSTKVDETSEGLEINKQGKCKFTIRHEEDGKVLFDKTVTDSDNILDVLLEYYKTCHNLDFDKYSFFSPDSFKDLTDIFNKYFK